MPENLAQGANGGLVVLPPAPTLPILFPGSQIPNCRGLNHFNTATNHHTQSIRWSPKMYYAKCTHGASHDHIRWEQVRQIIQRRQKPQTGLKIIRTFQCTDKLISNKRVQVVECPKQNSESTTSLIVNPRADSGPGQPRTDGGDDDSLRVSETKHRNGKREIQ